MINFLVWIIVGGLAGWVASLIMKTDAEQGPLANIIIGMVGALIGGFIVTLLTKGNADLTTAYTNFSLTSLLVSILGAVILIGAMKMLRKAA